MTFHASAEEDSVRVEGSTLFGRLRDMGGNLQDAAINLDEFLGNNDGTKSVSSYRVSILTSMM